MTEAAKICANCRLYDRRNARAGLCRLDFAETEPGMDACDYMEARIR
jgi:hypothetical protein